jgi:hypothetical protein
MRAAPTVMATIAAPTAAMNKASASGTVPSIHKKWTSTLPVFCSMNTIRTTKLATAAPIPIQAAPVRVRGTRRVGGAESPSTGD